MLVSLKVWTTYIKHIFTSMYIFNVTTMEIYSSLSMLASTRQVDKTGSLISNGGSFSKSGLMWNMAVYVILFYISIFHIINKRHSHMRK